MDKKTYYVTLGTGEILEDPTGINYELEIIASLEEVRALKALFIELQAQEFESFIDVFKLNLDSEDVTNDLYDSKLIQIYNKIYELGNTKTKHFMEENFNLMTQIQKNDTTF